jgi:hypothetical protein
MTRFPTFHRGPSEFDNFDPPDPPEPRDADAEQRAIDEDAERRMEQQRDEEMGSAFDDEAGGPRPTGSS